MSDIYVPGVKSRFGTDKLIEDLMKVERVPQQRVEKNVESLQTQKTYWQDLGRHIGSLRESARILFSFQNPFNDKVASSSDESVISGLATREAKEQEYRFTVKQVAQADRFLSTPLSNDFKIEKGDYEFTVGEDKVSFNFRGGTVKEFVDALNRRGRDLVGASLISVEPGTKSLLIESKVSGDNKRLGFGEAAEKLAIEAGIIEQVPSSRRDINLEGGTLSVKAGNTASIRLNPVLQSAENLVLRFETATEIRSREALEIPQPPPGPLIPSPGSLTYGGITIENEPSSAPLPVWTPPEPPKQVDDLNMISLKFTDGSSVMLPAMHDSQGFTSSQWRLSDVAGSGTIASIEINNRNTHRDMSIRNITVFDPDAPGGVRPRNAISTARDAIITMEGIEIRRPSNDITDLIPGLTVTARGVSDRPVTLGVTPDREGVKESIISLVGNYNRLMAEVNVLTRRDDKIIQELSYLSKEEQDELSKRQGVFSGDSTLAQFKNNLQRSASVPYPASTDQDLIMLAQIGISTDVRRSGAGGSYDPSRLRGYLEIDEKVLDHALETQLPVIQQLFGSDADGDLIIDSGLAYSLDQLTKPYVETGGFILLKTGTIDSRISQDQRRIDTMERQLAAKETALKIQYGQMEGAYTRMERMQNSLDQFSRQNSPNNR
ncbi:MAG: flagellar filament capping protein FliD [Treponema sp.]|jgi:flagellar hook-associated protein 2|nr:flagellar filament capping protein FliD [Treponema sp.]